MIDLNSLKEKVLHAIKPGDDTYDELDDELDTPVVERSRGLREEREEPRTNPSGEKKGLSNLIPGGLGSFHMATPREQPRSGGFLGRMEPKQRLRFIYLTGLVLVMLVCLGALVYAALFSRGARFNREMERGEQYMANGQYQMAIESYDVVLKIDEKCTDAYLNRARAYAAINDYANAQKDYEAALELQPDNYEIYLSLAQVLVAQTKTDDAIKVLTTGYNATKSSPVYDLLYQLRSSSGDTMVSGSVYAFNGVLGGASSGAKISLRDRNLDREMGITYTDDAGNYEFATVAGDYTLSVTYEGSLPFSYDFSIQNGEKLAMERVLLINENNANGNGNIQASIKEAAEGLPLQGVEVHLRSGWNNTTGDVVALSTTDVPKTNENGVVTVDSIPAGYYTVEYSCPGYVPIYMNEAITANTTSYPRTCICPVSGENDGYVVLTWGDSVTDLDLNVRGVGATASSINVDYSQRTYNDGSAVRLNLTQKNSTGNGPETVQIINGIVGEGYTVVVHDYDNRAKDSSSALSNCEAMVQVYHGGELVDTVRIPAGNVGTYWYACTISPDWHVTLINDFASNIS